MQGRSWPALLRWLLLHRRVGHRPQHLIAGRPISGVPPATHCTLPHHQLHERVLHLQEHTRHCSAALQVSQLILGMTTAEGSTSLSRNIDVLYEPSQTNKRSSI